MASYMELIQTIAESILEKVDERITKKDSGTKVYKAKVVEIPSLSKVKVEIDGVVHTASSTIYCEIEDFVRIVVPNNNWKMLYVESNITSGKTLRDLHNALRIPQAGTVEAEIPSESYLDIDVLFQTKFSYIPVVTASLNIATDSSDYSGLVLTVASRTESGCVIRVINPKETVMIVDIAWIAV